MRRAQNVLFWLTLSADLRPLRGMSVHFAWAVIAYTYGPAEVCVRLRALSRMD
jgi:hypothetical protein